MKTHFDILDRRSQFTIAAASAIAITAAVLGVMRMSASHPEITLAPVTSITSSSPVLLETVVVHAAIPATDLTTTQLSPIVVHAHPAQVAVAHHEAEPHQTSDKTVARAGRPHTAAVPQRAFSANMSPKAG